MSDTESEFFRQATLNIFSSLDIQTAMARLMAYLKGYLPISGISFAIYDPEINVGRLLAAIWPEELERPAQTISFPNEFWQFIKSKWQSEEKVMVINDLAAQPEELQKVFGAIWSEDYSHLIIALKLDQMRLGRFSIIARNKHQYTQEHIHLITLLHEPLAIACNNILQHQEIERLKDMLADDNRYLKRQMLEMTGETIVGANFGLKNVFQMVNQVAPTNSPVLLMGETGVGKEVIANTIHDYSTRRDKPFIKVNCGAIPENLIDSELFGHEKGAFTGALAKKRGRFERAHTGTIFLDEIGELPAAAQVRLLRVLQQHEIERVGGSEVIPVDVRIISATNRNLEEMVQGGEFREDLWFRLNVFPIIIPPLRQRRMDIPALISHFIERKSKELKIRNKPTLSAKTMEALQAYQWPGNVRELENIVERTLILNKMQKNSNMLSFNLSVKQTIPEILEEPSETSSEIPTLDTLIANHIRMVLAKTKGRIEGPHGAAKILNLHPSTLRWRMKKLGIPYGRKREGVRA